MNTFKIKKLPFAEMTFKEWKIRENSKLSYGDPIFIYEYQINGVLRKEKYKSSLNGITVKSILAIKPNEILKSEIELFKYDTCTHPIISNEMCGVCGEDLKTQNEIEARKKMLMTKASKPNENSASVKIVHAEPRIKVSKTEALEIGKRDLDNLVKQKKLVLLVDLDHTVIHTTNDTVPNDIDEVYHYELWQKNVWYHTKFRPNCKKFLEEMSKRFELHMVTFGERSYAHKIASFIDPDKRFFHDRILSRNEIFNPISKTDNLKALFPRGDLMVCIIDDREDVWNYARNLICVQPYVYFKNTGDINDPNKSSSNAKNSKKRKMLENMNAYKTQQQSKSVKTIKKGIEETEKSGEENLNIEENISNILTDSKSNDDNSVDSTLSTGSNGSTTSDSNNSENAGKKENLVKKIKVLETDKENSEVKRPIEETETDCGKDDDPDDYLNYLEKILTSIHDEYYKIYANRIKSKHQTSELDESDLPDLKRVIPMLKSRILENVVITFSGVVPTDYDLKKQRCYLMAIALGARVNEHLVLGEKIDEIENSNDEDSQKKNSRNYEYSYDESSSSNTSGGDSKNDSSFSNTSAESVALSVNNEDEKNIKKTSKKRLTTHLVAAKFGTSKVHEALRSKRKVNVVTPEWLINCNFKWEKCEEKLFALTKEYDYTNCSFHNEYNMHQKFAAASEKSKTTTKRQYTEISTSLQKTGSTSTKHKDLMKLSSDDNKNNKIKRADNFFTSETFYGEESNTDDFKLDEKLFDQMDKEVEAELDDTDSSDFDGNDTKNEEDENLSDSKNNDESSNDSSNKSSSLNASNDDEFGDIDDDILCMDLEKDF